MQDTDEEEFKNVSDDEEEVKQTTDQEPVYNSIRERYGKTFKKPKRENMILQSTSSRHLRREISTDVEPQQRNTLPEETIPGEDGDDSQGLIQLLSSKLLCQILSAGDLFQSHFTEKLEETAEQLRSQYFSMWYENLLKSRIFLADRHERVERALQRIGLIPKDEEEKQEPIKENSDEEFDIEEVDVQQIEEKLQDPEVVQTIYKYILDDEENYQI